MMEQNGDEDRENEIKRKERVRREINTGMPGRENAPEVNLVLLI